jgi:hypothetical protein
MSGLDKEFDVWVDNQDWDKVDLVVMIGLGPRGARARKLRSATPAALLVYEPRPEIQKMYTAVKQCLVSPTLASFRSRLRGKFQDLHGDGYLIEDEDETDAISRVVGDDTLKEVIEVYHSAKIDAECKMLSAPFTAHERVVNMLQSFHLLTQNPPINLLFSAFEGKAGVIVGAGPSLDRNIDVLREYRDRFIIGAVNTSWTALDAAGIQPDFVVICEAKQVGHTIEDIPSLPETIMVPGNHVNEETWALPWRRVAPALSDEGAFGEWARTAMGVVPAAIGSSSATLVAGVLQVLGCDPLVLVGNDCAYADDGQLYSSTAAFAGTTVEDRDGMAVIVKSDSKLSVEDVGPQNRESATPLVFPWAWGRKGEFDAEGNECRVRAPIIYDGIRQWWEEVGEIFSCRCINSTEGGAHIENWESITLRDVAETLSPIDVNIPDAIDHSLAQADITKPERIAELLDEQADGSREIGELCREGVSLMDRAIVLYEELKQSQDPISKYTWDRIERGRRESERIFETFSEAFAKTDAPQSAELSGIMKRAREIQIEMGRSGSRGTLLDAYSWGFVEQARRRGDRSVFGIFKGMFQEVERGSVEIIAELEKAKEAIL